MKPYTTQAHINSLGGKLGEVTIISVDESKPQPVYIADYNGTRCTAIFNWFTCSYYVDDIYGIIK